MLTVNLNSARLNLKLREFAKIANKNASDSVRDEAAFVAQGLVKLTPPGKVGEGKRRVSIDVNKVYLASKWFTEIFQFKSKPLGERVKAAVRSKDTTALEGIFDRSSKLRRVRVEPFDQSRHKSLRKNGRVPNNWHPGSFPLNQESQEKRYEREKQANVGLAKSGWAACVGALGRSVASWLQKGSTGGIKDNLSNPTKPNVILINRVGYMGDLDRRKGILERVLAGRVKALGKKIEVAMRIAAAKAGL